MRSQFHLAALLVAATMFAHSVDCYPEYSMTTYYQYPPPRGAQLRESTASASSSHHHHYQRSSFGQPSSLVARQFASPSLESAAFTMALSREGYAVAADSHSHSHSHSQLNSQNVKLPVPLGVSPISFAPLPLQAGAPYSTVHGVTSYGTPYPQRRRR